MYGFKIQVDFKISFPLVKTLNRDAILSYAHLVSCDAKAHRPIIPYHGIQPIHESF